ncbi:hypothetical protein [Crocosphaera chwakensis]|uniref:Uncharacterized protein n=1 Tax=Crocosphaera chwakensis CCY0110 TaxID=391612 RepID=A3IXR3_9CHRO|nr:hypothetical protein [Crocosphaera chwakensis]EAZ88716.1 hypothetical protein CY0110_01115 [Crocosphaera chwakensis CCY0110]
MQVKWKKLLLYLFITLMSEILLNFLGLDDLADYSEFIFQKSSLVLLSSNTYSYQ